MKKKVNLFIIGAPKCGTTSLYSYLAQHEKISGGKAKEPHYFNSDFPNFRWFHSLSEYENNYLLNNSSDYYIDSSVMYLYSNNAIENIYNYNPNAKIIIMVRELTDFYLSFHNQNLYNLDENLECPNEAWRVQKDRFNGNNIPSNCREKKFLHYSNCLDFKLHIEKVCKVFPSEQIVVIPFDLWKNNVAVYQDYLINWLCLEKKNDFNFIKQNSKRKHRFNFISALTNRPPKLLLMLSSFIKKIFKINRLGLAGKLRTINTSEAEYMNLEQDVLSDIKKISDSNFEYINSITLKL